MIAMVVENVKKAIMEILGTRLVVNSALKERR